MTDTSHTGDVIRRAIALTLTTGMLLLVLAGAAAASGGSVVVKESGNRYHFIPNSISISVGQSVTWSNGSDVPHTVTSDAAGGPLDGQLSPGGADYTAKFSAAGDYAYHCSIHTYMQGVVHVAALPPTDAAVTATGSGSGSVGLGTETLAAIAGVALGFAGLLTFSLRRRAIRA
jgi:plastocyanin